MKKRWFFVFLIFLLAACERPATLASWSPINDVSTPGASTEVSGTATAGLEPTDAAATSQPTLDLDTLPDKLPKSLKGYELVSWQSGKNWMFTLVTGTNREKSFEELMSPESEISDDGFVKITVTGSDQIKKVLGKLPEGSSVFWGGMNLTGQVPDGTVYFSFPPDVMMNDIAEYCARSGIDLMNLSEPE